MLHPVPDSTLRARLLEVVEMQQQLLDALCALPQAAIVDHAWLGTLWPALPMDWVRRFWQNDSGNRAMWINVIAAASVNEKLKIRALMAEQLRFVELYDSPATVRLSDQNWAPPVFMAVKQLLISFYAPLFYQDEGYPNSDGTPFHKEHFINPRPTICPYTDNLIQDPKLDHFLPKDRFPMLSCHPDNLIPCSTDANSGSHKGTKVPLNLQAADQASDWFHPRFRSANGTYRLTFVSPSSAHQPRIQFIAINGADQARLDNLEALFGLGDFWGRYLDDEVQSIAGDVQGWLKDDGKAVTEPNVRDYVRRRARQEQNRIGRDGLAIARSYFYEHIAQTPVLLAQVVRTCINGT